MNRSHRAALALAFLAAGLAARGQPSLIDQLFERHIRVKAATGAGVLHVLYERKTDPQAAPSSCYRRYVPGKGWLGEEQLQGAHRCVAFCQDALYVFRQDNYSVYRAADWTSYYIFRQDEGGQKSTWTSRKWLLPWSPEAACRVGDEVWVFGVDASGAVPGIRVARLAVASPDGLGPEPADAGKALTTASEASDLCALGRGGAARVFWHLSAGTGLSNELWQATFDGAAWSAPQRVPTPYPLSDYAVADHAGSVWLFCKARGERVKTSVPMMAASLANGRWSPPSPVPDALDPRFDWTLDIDAASFDGALYLFRACMNRVVAHRWSDGRWLAPETLFQLSPWPTYLFWWLMANIVVSLVLLPIVALSAFRVRGRPRLLIDAFGAQVPVASWSRRVAAQLVDILLTLLICSLALQWLGLVEGDGASEAEAFLSTIGVYSGIFFAYFALSEGIMGQSMGKWVLRIAVVGRDGRRPSILSVVLRNLLRPWPFLVPAAYLAGSLFLLLTATNQRLGDLLARTFVVDRPAEPRPEPEPTDFDA